MDYTNGHIKSRIYTVSELTFKIKDILEESFPIVWINGEISNFTLPASGHYYFNLKDENNDNKKEEPTEYYIPKWVYKKVFKYNKKKHIFKHLDK